MGVIRDWWDPDNYRLSVWHDRRIRDQASFVRVVFLDALMFVLVKLRSTGSLVGVRKFIAQRTGLALLESRSETVELRPSTLDAITAYEAQLPIHAHVWGEYRASRSR